MSITSGFFLQNCSPLYRQWTSQKFMKYIQSEVTRRLAKKYVDPVIYDLDAIRTYFIHNLTSNHQPMNLDQLLEHTICLIVQALDTELEGYSRFNNFEPRTLYHPQSGITMAERVKTRQTPKFEFQMRY
jgi:hypothetical protein